MPSLLRGYSAPVKLAVEGQTDEDLVLLLAHDTGGWAQGGGRAGAGGRQFLELAPCSCIAGARRALPLARSSTLFPMQAE